MTAQHQQLDIFSAVPETFTPLPTKRDQYYNTTRMEGKELAVREMKTEAQGRKILDFFRSNPGILFTPFDVQNKLNLTGVPITSIRRSMTNLTCCYEKYLIKTSVKRPGIYGEPNHCWVLNKEANQDCYTLTLKS